MGPAKERNLRRAHVVARERGCGAGSRSGPERASGGHLVAVLGGGEPAFGIHVWGPGTWENAGASLSAPGTPLCRAFLPPPAPTAGPCGCRHPERGEAREAGEPWKPDAVRVSRWRGPGPLAPAWPFLLVETLVVCVPSRPDPGEQRGGPLILSRATERGRGAPADQWACRPCRGSVETWRWRAAWRTADLVACHRARPRSSRRPVGVPSLSRLCGDLAMVSGPCPQWWRTRPWGARLSGAPGHPRFSRALAPAGQLRGREGGSVPSCPVARLSGPAPKRCRDGAGWISRCGGGECAFWRRSPCSDR
ncbi:uncharacterized protein LOC125120771 [Phacochoerus africanus]|uniref:uncharacterized protein LOC125120771 n=1 Tax=Phacochoerus africanus TaxID=41426 RepID=UPI001FD894DA|nr:uncharacterized protein LOC125120771 [Phacochoerus africanus]